MKFIGDPIFARDATGRLKSRVGTVFLRTPGLVTAGVTHFLQRDLWISSLNEARASAGQPKLTDDEEMAERERSVDLLFTDKLVLIRPDPYAMALAFEADELLQGLVSKRRIRYLNIHNERVRSALTARGENWRMSRIPVSGFELNNLIAGARVALNNAPLYFYNRSTGTRFLTLESFRWVGTLQPEEFRKHLREIAKFAALRNRFGHPEVDVFPPSCAFSRQAFEALNAEGLSDEALRAAYDKLLETFTSSVPKPLRKESPDNIEWRNLLCSALTAEPNAMETEEILTGVSKEFYRQIDWRAGLRLEDGEAIFDPVFDEPDAYPDDPELRALCDPRARSVLFNYLRERTNIEYINIGAIAHSLSRRQTDSELRPNVYVVQLKETDKPEAALQILRFQKWSIQEHLDKKTDWDENRCMIDAVDYIDYVFNRRLGCHQFGMALSKCVTIGRIREVYRGRRRELHDKEYWIVYFIRDYVKGCASDKISEDRYADPEFSRRLARLLGDAAAVNIVVGRADLELRVMFDDGDEVVIENAHGMPDALVVSDNTGSFADYLRPLEAVAASYAKPVNKRQELLPDAAEFAEAYLEAFQRRLARIQQEYAARRRAFDTLFKHLPVDVNGSFAYRWQRVLARLADAKPAELTAAIRGYIKALNP
jgi:hypothetical protein